MTRFELEKLDSGRLVINQAFRQLFQEQGWTDFATIWSQTADAAVAKKLRTDRITLRFSLNDQGEQRHFYIKRHGRSSWKEYLKPLLRLTWPILGARNEWNAILAFHTIGLPTMTPVAFGESGAQSFLITESLENCRKLSELRFDATSPSQAAIRARFVRQLAQLTRKMHGAGIHHQDFYLGHLLQSQPHPDSIYIIDLGRVRKHQTLSTRWIIKDLAQLDFSADATLFEQVRFLRDYLGRPLKTDDRRLMARIQSKKASISRHSRKNRL